MCVRKADTAAAERGGIKPGSSAVPGSRENVEVWVTTLFFLLVMYHKKLSPQLYDLNKPLGIKRFILGVKRQQQQKTHAIQIITTKLVRSDSGSDGS